VTDLNCELNQIERQQNIPRAIIKRPLARWLNMRWIFFASSNIQPFDSTTFDTSVWVYPSLVIPGRVRVTLNQDIYYEFLGDFYARLSFYDNDDNKPVIGAPPNNLGASTTIGWSFH
jgi:hypothetical protein